MNFFLPCPRMKNQFAISNETLLHHMSVWLRKTEKVHVDAQGSVERMFQYCWSGRIEIAKHAHKHSSYSA